MWWRRELGEDFQYPTDMRSVLELEVEDGTTGGKLFEKMAERYGPVQERIIPDHRFSSCVVFLMNGQFITADDLYQRILGNGDEITVLPAYSGG